LAAAARCRSLRCADPGQARPKVASLLNDPTTRWRRHTVPLWYSQINRTIEFASGTALWYRAGIAPVPIRWVLVRDPDGVLEPQAFLCTNTETEPADILGWFIMRWQVELTFEETRAHLGVETQRQWSDLAILRTTPALLGLFSIVCLWAHDINAATALIPRTAAWYRKPVPTFSDAIAAVRRQIWEHQNIFMSRQSRDCVQIPREIWNRMADALAHAA